jgi:hypothetical protein
MGNLCIKDDCNDYSLLPENKNIDNMEALIHKLTIGVKNLEKDVKNLEKENFRLKKVNQTLLSKVVEQKD